MNGDNIVYAQLVAEITNKYFNKELTKIMNQYFDKEVNEKYEEKMNLLNFHQLHSLIILSIEQIQKNNINTNLIDNLLVSFKNKATIENYKLYQWKIFIELLKVEEEHLSGDKLKIFKNMLISSLEFVSKEDINSIHMSFIAENYLYSSILTNIVSNIKNKWMLPIFINFGLDIHTVGDYPTIGYLYAISNQENFDSYLEYLLSLGLDSNKKNVNGENTFLQLYRNMIGKVELGGTCSLNDSHFQLLKKYGAEVNCINNKNHNILSLFLKSTLYSEITIDELDNSATEEKVKQKALINIIRNNIESLSFKEIDILGHTIVSDFNNNLCSTISKEDKIEQLSFTLAVLKDKNAKLLEKNALGNSFFDELMKTDMLEKVILLLNEKYNLNFSHLTKQVNENSEEYKSYNNLEKSLSTWIKENNHIEMFKNIYKGNTVKEECLTIELYTEEDYKIFNQYVNTLANAENSKAFLKKSKVNSKYRIKNYAKSVELLKKIDTLKEKFPHFGEVIEHIENHCVLQESGNKAFYIPPILLGGGPGIGKTFFSHTVAQMVDTYFHVFNMESISQSATLTGAAEFWGTSAPGKIFSTLTEEKNINPIFLLDELDKCLGDERYSASAALLPLMEGYTAKRFVDECIQLPIDASKVIWIATGNELSKISAPLKSRFDIFNVPAPNFAERKKMLNGVYQSILKNNTWGKNLASDLPDTVLDMLADMNSPGAIRDMRRIITTACSRAIRNNRSEIIESDIGKLNKPIKMLWDLPFASE